MLEFPETSELRTTFRENWDVRVVKIAERARIPSTREKIMSMVFI